MASLFDKIKEEVSIAEICELLDIELKSSGVNSIPDDDTCPLPECGHKGAFRVNPAEGYFKCFSCGNGGDGIKLFQLVKQLDSSFEAAKQIAKEKNIELPRGSMIQDLYETVASYYHEQLLTAPKKLTLEGLTPLEYQIQRRGHSLEFLKRFRVGWTDGRLGEYLYALGITVEENPFLTAKGKDYFGSDFFIYPHVTKGKASHFTIKDPKKQVAYQLKKVHTLNNSLFYNQDSIKDARNILVVEGENDVITATEAQWDGGVIGTIGSLSADQIKFLKDLALTSTVFTGFDIDTAGDKYREKVLTGRHLFVPKGKDIDDYFKKNGGAWPDLLATEKTIEQQKPITKPTLYPISVVNGCYYIRKEKGDQFWDVPLTNFTIELQNVYFYPRNCTRSREVVFISQAGTRSRVTQVTSDAKTSARSFTVLCANAIDGSFYGSENDLKTLWDYLYSQGEPKEVIIPAGVGHLGKDIGGWLFKSMFIADNGEVTKRGDDGVFWLRQGGLKPQSLLAENNSERDIPEVQEVSREEGEALVREFTMHLGENMGTGLALICVAWAWACVYSNEYFDAKGQFPFLLVNGSFGKGKTSIARWIASIFGPPESRSMSAVQLKSGAGSLRKIAFYNSVPVVIDEIRADKEHRELYATFRAMFHRQGRSLAATTDVYSVREQEVGCPILFAGQDGFEADPALQERCLSVIVPPEHQIPKKIRDDSYKWINARVRHLSKIGYHWITNPIPSYLQEVEAANEWANNEGVSNRSAHSWACVLPFVQRLLPYFPGFDFKEYMLTHALAEAEDRNDEQLAYSFLEAIEGILVEEHPTITGEHIHVEGDYIYLWFREIFVQIQPRWRNGFTKSAVLTDIRSQSWFHKDSVRHPLGVRGERRRTLVLDLTKGPPSLQNIAKSMS